MAAEVYSILVLGDAGVGKTSIIQRFVTDSFSEQHTDYLSSYRKQVTVDDQACILEVTDVPPDVDYTQKMLTQCHGIILVYSMLSMPSFHRMHEMHEAIHEVCHRLSIPAPDMCIVGNMSDRSDGQEVSLTDALDFMKFLSRSTCSLCIHYYGVSAKTGHNVEKIFFNLVSYIRSSKAARETEDSAEYAASVANVESKAESLPPRRPRISQLLVPGYWVRFLRRTDKRPTRIEPANQHLVPKFARKILVGSQPSTRSASSWLYNILLKYTWTLFKLLIHALIYFGVVMPPIKSGEIRVHWGCLCGKTFYNDISSSDWQKVAAVSQYHKIEKSYSQQRTEPESQEHHDAAQGSPQPLHPNSELGRENQGFSTLPHPDLHSSEGEISTNDSMSWDSGGIHNPMITDGLRSRRVRTNVMDNMDKWLLTCLPGKGKGNDPGIIKHMLATTKKDDKSMIKEIRELYESRTSKWSQFRHLRGFSNVRLIKFRLMRSHISDTWAAENNWTWPYQTPGWECRTKEIPVEIFDQQMLHYWKSPGPSHQATSRAKATRKRKWGIYRSSRLPLREQDLKEQPLSFSRILSVLASALSPSFAPPDNSSTKHRSIFQHLRLFRRASTSQSTANYPSQTMPSNTEPPIEVDLSPSQYWLFHALPKKVEGKLTWPPECYQPPPGWGICVEEGFAIPWYVFVLLLVVPVASLCFAVAWWALHGPTMFDVAAAAIGAMSFVFAVWVAVVRDGKR